MASKPKYNKFANRSERVKTFSKYPKNYPAKEDLVDAGFFYTGLGDEDDCVCYFCGVKILKWDENDVPIVEHERFRPKCKVVRDSKDSNKPTETPQSNQSIAKNPNQMTRLPANESACNQSSTLPIFQNPNDINSVQTQANKYPSQAAIQGQSNYNQQTENITTPASVPQQTWKLGDPLPPTNASNPQITSETNSTQIAPHPIQTNNYPSQPAIQGQSNYNQQTENITRTPASVPQQTWKLGDPLPPTNASNPQMASETNSTQIAPHPIQTNNYPSQPAIQGQSNYNQQTENITRTPASVPQQTWKLGDPLPPTNASNPQITSETNSTQIAPHPIQTNNYPSQPAIQGQSNYNQQTENITRTPASVPQQTWKLGDPLPPTNASNSQITSETNSAQIAPHPIQSNNYPSQTAIQGQSNYNQQTENITRTPASVPQQTWKLGDPLPPTNASNSQITSETNSAQIAPHPIQSNNYPSQTAIQGQSNYNQQTENITTPASVPQQTWKLGDPLPPTNASNSQITSETNSAQIAPHPIQSNNYPSQTAIQGQSNYNQQTENITTPVSVPQQTWKLGDPLPPTNAPNPQMASDTNSAQIAPHPIQTNNYPSQTATQGQSNYNQQTENITRTPASVPQQTWKLGDPLPPTNASNPQITSETNSAQIAPHSIQTNNYPSQTATQGQSNYNQQTENITRTPASVPQQTWKLGDPLPPTNAPNPQMASDTNSAQIAPHPIQTNNYPSQTATQGQSNYNQQTENITRTPASVPQQTWKLGDPLPPTNASNPQITSETNSAQIAPHSIQTNNYPSQTATQGQSNYNQQTENITRTPASVPQQTWKLGDPLPPTNASNSQITSETNSAQIAPHPIQSNNYPSQTAIQGQSNYNQQTENITTPVSVPQQTWKLGDPLPPTNAPNPQMASDTNSAQIAPHPIQTNNYPSQTATQGQSNYNQQTENITRTPASVPQQTWKLGDPLPPTNASNPQITSETNSAQIAPHSIQTNNYPSQTATQGQSNYNQQTENITRTPASVPQQTWKLGDPLPPTNAPNPQMASETNSAQIAPHPIQTNNYPSQTATQGQSNYNQQTENITRTPASVPQQTWKLGDPLPPTNASNPQITSETNSAQITPHSIQTNNYPSQTAIQGQSNYNQQTENITRTPASVPQQTWKLGDPLPPTNASNPQITSETNSAQIAPHPIQANNYPSQTAIQGQSRTVTNEPSIEPTSGNNQFNPGLSNNDQSTTMGNAEFVIRWCCYYM